MCVTKLPEADQRMLDELHPHGSVLAGKKVLIVDDDIRNIFAVTSVLERHQMAIAAAETGRAAIEILQNPPDIDIVLMDIMMPEMDGPRHDAGDSQAAGIQESADCGRHRQSHEGRS